MGNEDKRLLLEEKFRDELKDVVKDAEANDLVERFFKFVRYLERKKIIRYQE